MFVALNQICLNLTLFLCRIMSVVMTNSASGSKNTRSASRPGLIAPFLCCILHKWAGPELKYLLIEVKSKPRASAAVQNNDSPEIMVYCIICAVVLFFSFSFTIYIQNLHIKILFKNIINYINICTFLPIFQYTLPVVRQRTKQIK